MEPERPLTADPRRRTHVQGGSGTAGSASDHASSEGSPIATVRGLQHSAGNKATAALFARAQAKLVVGATGDKYEREADAVAERVVRAMGATATSDSAAAVQRAGASPAASAREPEVGPQGGEPTPRTAASITAARSGGEPIPPEVRLGFETAMDADLSAVRLHTGPTSADLNGQLGARAFTVGHDVFFGEGMPDTGSRDGTSLMAHELTHVVQQGGAQARRTPSERIQRDDRPEAAVPTPKESALLDHVAATIVDAELAAARATLLHHLSRGLGVGGAGFWRSTEVRAFRQQMKVAARARAAEDIAQIVAGGGQGPATKQYLELFAKGDAYAAAKKSVDGELADAAEVWMRQHWDLDSAGRRDVALRRVHAAMWPILAPSPYDPKRLKKAHALGDTLATGLIEEFADAQEVAATTWKNAFIKPDVNDDAAMGAASTKREGLANEVGIRAGRDEIGRKSVKKAIRANTTDEGMGIIGKLLDKAIPQPGDTVSISVELKIPIPDTPAFVTLTFEGKAGRGITGFTTSGVATLGDPDRLEIMAQFSVGAGVGADMVGLKIEASGSVGFLVRSGSDDGTYATMKAMSYGAYRTACGMSRQFGNWWAGSGSGVDEGKTQRSEIWAAMVEEQVFTKEGNAFADLGGAAQAGASAEMDLGLMGDGDSGFGLEAKAALAAELFKRYDRDGLEESLGEDYFARPVADKRAAQVRRARAEGRTVGSVGFSSEVGFAIAGQAVGFGLSFSGEKAGGSNNGFWKNWGAEITASLNLPADATSRISEIAAGFVGGATSAAQNIGQIVQKGAAKDGPGSVVGGGLDTTTDVVRILNAGFENKIAEGLNEAWTQGGEGVMSPSSKLEAAITFGMSSGYFVCRFELRESKTLELSLGLGTAGVKVEASRGKRIFAFEYKRAEDPDDPTKTVNNVDLEIAGFRPLAST